MTDQSFLLTGSSGTIGTVLAERLLDRGFDITGADVESNRWSGAVDAVTIEVDLRDRGAVNRLPDVDTIVHLAANARVHDLVEDPTRARDNFETTFNVLEHARSTGASNVILASSREVYGNRSKIVHSETDTYVDECESPYTASKIGSESMLKAYGRCYGLDTCILRFSNVYGRYDASNRVVPLFVARAHRDRPLTVYGPEKVLDFTHVEDCVDGTLRAIDRLEKARGTTFNIASGSGSSLLELAEAIVDRTRSDGEIRVEPGRTGEVSKYVADVSKATKVLGYRPAYSLDDGLTETIEWYRDNRELFDEILA
jgi:UDP-glucose 4-epimerase